MIFELPEKPLILHDELIHEQGQVVGVTTSGARGARTRKTFALGLVNIAVGETLSETCTRRFSIDVAGKMYEAIPLRRPPFDPKNERMKS